MPCKANNIYPTFESIEQCFAQAEMRLPIQSHNDLVWLVNVITNTLVNKQ
jgi:hypothetical protein